MKVCPRFAILIFAVVTIHAVTGFANDSIGLHSIAAPLVFEPNRGQAPDKVKFLSRGVDGDIFIEEDAMTAVLSDGKTHTSLRMRFSGHGRRVQLVAEEATGGVANYYRTADHRQWLEGIPFYNKVHYREVYPGIDLVFHGRNGKLEYDFSVQPGRGVSAIELNFPDADSLAVDADGSLLVRRGGKSLRLLAPAAFQGQEEKQRRVDVRYQVTSRRRVVFKVGHYDAGQTLVIDPVVAYTKFIGVDNSTTLNAMTTDSAGNLYLTGGTLARNYPNPSGSRVNMYLGNGAFYVTKLDSSGNNILYSTVLNAGEGTAITLDASGNAYVAGIATSSAFPTTSQTLGTCDQSCNAGFAAKFNRSGALVYATLLASGQVLPKAITVASGGQALLTGLAADNTLQTVNAFQGQYTATIGSCYIGCTSPFFVGLNAAGTGYEFASYFGNGGGASGIALDPSGNIYLTGSGWVPTLNPLVAGVVDYTQGIFVSEFSPDGKTLRASTYIGTLYNQNVLSPAGIVAASDGSIYVSGVTDGQDFPFTLNANRLPQVPLDSYIFNIFAMGLKPGLTGINYSTYLGQGMANAVAIDKTNNLYIAGAFGPEPLSLKNPVVSGLTGGGFVMTLGEAGNTIMATQFGGQSELEIPTSVAVDGSDNIYLAGVPASSTGAPLGNLLDTVDVGTGLAYNQQAAVGRNVSFTSYATFAAKISPSNEPQVSLTYWPPFLALRDAGSLDLNIASITSAGSPLIESCGNKVAAGTECIIDCVIPGNTVCVGSVTVNSDAASAPQTYTPGSVQYVNTLPLLLQPPALYFPPQQVGTSSLPQTIKVWNLPLVP